MALAASPPRDRAKWALFALLGLLVIASAIVDDRFVFDPHDREWAKFATWWYLTPHALAGLAALLIGPLQFSDTLRRERPALHRALGRVYVGACLIAAPLAAMIAWEHNNHSIAQTTEGVLWGLVTLLAWVNAVRRNLPAHKLWMMRSFGFYMVFIMGRLPDAIPHFQWTETVLWFESLIALMVPDLLLNGRELWRRRKKAG